MARIFVVGSNSFIAKRLIKHKFFCDCELYLVNRNPNENEIFLDLNKAGEFDYNLLKDNDIILFLASISSPDVCSNKYNEAYSVNVEGTELFIKNAIMRNSNVLFFSSDTVYGETTQPVNEQSVVHPYGNYAKMKNEIEKNFLGDEKFKSLRLSYVFSINDKFTHYLINCTTNDDIASIFHPYKRCIIYIEDVIYGIEKIISNWEKITTNVVNFAGPELISRVDFVEFIKKIAVNKLEYKVEEPDSNFFKQKPKVINMRSIYLQEILGKNLTSIDTAISLEFNKRN